MLPYWERLFEEPVPEHFTFYPGAHFVVTRETLHRRTRSFYEQALEIATSLEHAGHCFERTWDHVFGVKAIPETYRNAELPVYFRPIKRLGITWDSAAP